MEPRTHLLGRGRILVEQPHVQPEHVLEVEAAHRPLATLVSLVHAVHQLGRDRGLVLAERREVALRRDHPVLRPLDLARQLASRQELVRRRQRVRERRDQRRLVVEHGGQRLAGVRGPQSGQLRERRRVEGAGLDALDAETREPVLQFPRGLLGEGDREDLAGVEGAARDLVGDARGDRGRLARAGAGDDRHRAAHRLGRRPLGGVQPVERVRRRWHGLDPSTGPRRDRAPEATLRRWTVCRSGSARGTAPGRVATGSTRSRRSSTAT